MTRSIEQEKGNALDAYALDLKNKAFNIEKNTVLRKGLSYLFPFPINVIRYSKAIDKMVDVKFIRLFIRIGIILLEQVIVLQ